MRVKSHGLPQVPWSELKLCQSDSMSGTFVLPKTTAPAPRYFSTTAESVSTMLSRYSGTPQVVGEPVRSKLSFTVTGRPSSGPVTSPAARRRSEASASARARSASCRMIALIAWLCRSTRSRKCSSSSRAPTSRASSRDISSVADW